MWQRHCYRDDENNTFAVLYINRVQPGEGREMSENDEPGREESPQNTGVTSVGIKIEETAQGIPETNLFSMEQQDAAKGVSDLLQDLKIGQESMAIVLVALKDRVEQVASDISIATTDTEENTLAKALTQIDARIEKLCQSNRAALDSFGEFRTNLSRGWHDELKHYRELFSIGAYDNLLKKLGEIYIAVFNLIKEKSDTQFKEDMEWTVLEPIQELMESYGVSVKISEAGSKRSLRSMRSVRKHITSDKSMDGLIARSVAPGFLRRGDNEMSNVILIPEEVEHYSYKPDIVEMVGDGEQGKDVGAAETVARGIDNSAK